MHDIFLFSVFNIFIFHLQKCGSFTTYSGGGGVGLFRSLTVLTRDRNGIANYRFGHVILPMVIHVTISVPWTKRSGTEMVCICGRLT